MVFSLPDMESAAENQYEYVVVGSGAGGGTLAARLAEAGRRVLLLEAGGDPRELDGRRPPIARGEPAAGRLRRAGVSRASPLKTTLWRWSFFVRHHADRRAPPARSEVRRRGLAIATSTAFSTPVPARSVAAPRTTR